MGEGMEWVCMHATCSCGDDEAGHEEDLSSAASTSAFISAILLVVIVAFN
jgi:hypothetical protein